MMVECLVVTGNTAHLGSRNIMEEGSEEMVGARGCGECCEIMSSGHNSHTPELVPELDLHTLKTVDVPAQGPRW